jgi:hypothetical protein
MVDDINKVSGPSLQCFMSTKELFPWVKFNEIIVTDAEQGVMISLSFAFIVLIITTKNIIVSLLATYSISAIIVQMMAMISFNGWYFGIM